MAQNIEKFDLLTARIFADLYEQFPVRSDIMSDSYGIREGNTLAQMLIERDFFSATVCWLKESGYIDYSDDMMGLGFVNVVLTAKGLDVLKAMPKSLSSDKPLGDYLRDAVRNGATDALKNGVATALSAGATFAWHAMAR